MMIQKLYEKHLTLGRYIKYVHLKKRPFSNFGKIKLKITIIDYLPKKGLTNWVKKRLINYFPILGYLPNENINYNYLTHDLYVSNQVILEQLVSTTTTSPKVNIR